MASVSAQCEKGPDISETGKVVKTLFTTQKESSETGLAIKASAARTSWQKKGSEAAVLSVFINGIYNQDVILFAGEQSFDYRVVLGELKAGRYEITLHLNKERSAPNANDVRIESAAIFSAKFGDTREKIAVANSPIIYARPNAVDKFSDIPLLTYYEILSSEANTFKIRYTTIFTNEDGGTQTTALMARWGRTTDIEWVNELTYKHGQLVSETYQGPNHEAKIFTGTRTLGSHPLIYTVTQNNNFSDAGCSSLRTAPFPIRAQLSKKSRESVMDENPWTYRIMAEEAYREGRIDPNNLGVDTINDLRNYLYVEVYAKNNSSAIAVEAKTMDGETSRSDFGDEKLRVSRSGYQRIAVGFPSTGSVLHSLSLYCHSTNGEEKLANCTNAQIVSFIKLDQKFAPRKRYAPSSDARTLKPFKKVVWLLR